MRRRTLTLLATPAVIGALTVAVPALAGVDLSGGAPARSAAVKSTTKCFYVSNHGRRVRECLVPGPRGPRGLPGPAGPRGYRGYTGKTGSTGKEGKEGKQGPTGTARGYAIVQPTSPTLATLQTAHNITSVAEIKEGVFCVTPAAPINATEETVAVSPEISYGSSKLPGLIAVNAQRTGGCAAGTFEVDTYSPPVEKTPATLSDQYAFTIVVP